MGGTDFYRPLTILIFTHNFPLFKITVQTLVNAYSESLLVLGDPNFLHIHVGVSENFDAPTCLVCPPLQNITNERSLTDM